MAETIANDWTRTPGRWNGPDNTKNLRELKARQAAAVAATPPCPPLPPDPFTSAQLKIADLEGRVRELERELEVERARTTVSPHLKGRETR